MQDNSVFYWGGGVLYWLGLIIRGGHNPLTPWEITPLHRTEKGYNCKFLKSILKESLLE